MGLNHIYKVIWSKTKNAWVVVSEIAKRDGKSSVKSVVTSVAGKGIAATVVAMILCGGITSAASFATPGATATGTDSVAIGDLSKATGAGSVAIGHGSSVTGPRSVSILGDTNGTQSISIGSSVDGSNSVGISSYSRGDNNIAIGGSIDEKSAFTVRTYQRTELVGTGSYNNSIAIGSDVVSSNTVVIGKTNQRKYDPIGLDFQTNESKLNKSDLIAPKAVKYYSMVGPIGTPVGTGYIEGTLSNSVYLGNNSFAYTDDPDTDSETSFTGEKSLHTESYDASNHVVVSNNTTGGAFGKVSKTSINGEEITGFAGAQSVGAVTIGAGDHERRIQNVAAGEVSATSTDAVNGSQVYAIADTLSKNMNTYMHVNDGSVTQNAGNANSNLGVLGSKGGALGNYSIAVGVGAKASAERSIVVGNNAGSLSSNSILLSSSYNGSPQSLIGTNSSYSLNIGAGSIGDNSFSSVALNGRISDKSANSVSIGDSYVHGRNTIAISGSTRGKVVNDNEESVNNSIIINGKTSANNSIAIGGSVGATDDAIAGAGSTIVNGFTKNAENSIAIGHNTLVTQKNTIMLGNYDSDINSRKNSDSTKLISPAEHKADYPVASLDNYYEGSLSNSVYLGHESYAITPNALIDDENNTTGEHSIHTKRYDTVTGKVVTSTSTTGGAFGLVSKTDIDDATFTNFAGGQSVGAVTIGGGGTERRIQNVAAGEMSATSTDAVNGSQLYSTAKTLLDRMTNYVHVNDGTTTQKAGTASSNKGVLDTAGGATGKKSVAIGIDTQAAGENGVAVGNTAKATGKNSVAHGTDAEATEEDAIAIGNDAKAQGEKSISIGTGNIVKAAKSSVIGDPSYIDTTATGTHVQGNDNGTAAAPIMAKDSTFMGNNNLAGTAGTEGIHVVGNNNNIQSSNVMVLGNGITAGTGYDGAVILGNASATRAYTAPTNTTINGVTLDASKYAGTTAAGSTLSQGSIVSVGDAGKERQIKNVAAGEISATSTDAVTGSQLYGAVKALTESSSSPDVYVHVNDGTTTQKAGNATTNAGKADEKGGATGKNAVAAGVSSKASDENAISIGFNTEATGVSSIAMGTYHGDGVGTVSSGYEKSSRATGKNSIALGGADATGINSIAMGGNSYGYGLGNNGSLVSKATGDNSIAIMGQALNDFAIAIGSDSLSSGSGIALGNNSISKDVRSIAIDGQATGYYSIGISGIASKSESVAIRGTSKADYGMTLGGYIDTGAEAAVSFGSGSYSNGRNSIAIGKGASVGYAYEEPFGMYENVKSTESDIENSIAIGKNAAVSKKNTVMIGSYDKNDIIDYSVTTNTDASKFIAPAEYTWADGWGHGPIKQYYEGSLENSVYLGHESYAFTDDVTKDSPTSSSGEKSIHTKRYDTTTNTVVTSANTTGGAFGKVSTSTIEGVEFKNFAAEQSVGAVTVGGGGTERRIQNVAAGEVSATSTDAVNGSQLHSVAKTILTTPIKMTGDSGDTIGLKLGKTVNIKGSVASGADVTDGNIAVVGDKATSTLSLKMAKNLTGLTSGTFTDASGNQTVINGAGVTVTPIGTGATPISITTSGINAGNQEIKGVKKGTTDDAAVNKKQMDDALKGATDNTVSLGSESGSTTAKKLSTTGGITFNIKGETGANALITTSATGDDVTVAPTAKLTAAVTAAENAANKDLSNLNAAGDTYIKNLAKSAASWNVETNGAGTTAVAGGDTVNFINGDNIAITNTGRAITIGTAKDVAFDKVTVGGTSGIVIDGTAKQIGGLAAATANDQAVNKGQMDTAIANAQTAATSTEKVVAKTLTGDTNLATVTGRTGTAKGETYEVAVSENAVKAVAQTAAQDAVKVTGTGLATVSDATAAGVKTYTVNVDEGKLVIDDTTGKLGATGATQGTTAGKNGVATTQDVATVVNSAIDKTKQALDDAEHKFDGDTGTTSVRKHGEVLSIKGGVTTPADLTTGNIGVVSDGAGTLNIRLAKALTGLTSATYTDAAGNTQTVTGGSSTITDGAGNTTTITKGGVTTTDGTNTTTVAPSGVTATDGTHTVTLGGSGINAGGTEIKNVGKATTDDAAVNKKQMDDAVKAATDSVSTLGDNKVSLGSDAGTTNAKKLSTTGGIKFNIKGDAGANALITTSATGDDVTIAPTAKLTAAVTAAEKSADKDLSNLSAAGDTYIKNLAKSAASWNVETNGAGTTAVAGGDTVNFINGDNIAITNTGRAITIGTAKNVAFDKVTVGGTSGIVIDGTAKQIGGLAAATANDQAVNKGQMDTAIANAQTAATSTEKVVAKTLTGDTNLATVTGRTGTAKGETYEVAVSENAVKAVAQTAAQDAVKVTGTGLATVSDATAAGVKTYTVNVDEGKLVIDDTTGKLGATGATQGTTAGKNGVATTQDVATVVNSAIDKTKQALDDAEHKFDGDTGTTSVRKHGEVLSIKGGVTTPADLTTGNIGVVSDGAGTLNIRLAKALTGLTSATYTDAAGNTQTVTGGSSTITDGAGNTTTITKGGVTTTDGTNTTTVAPSGVTATDGTHTVTLGGSGINAGGTEIKNIGKATTDDAAVNKKQMDDALKGATDNTVSLGSESGSTTAKKLSTTGGITFNIKGETGANALITTSASGDDVTIAPTAKLTAAVTAAEKSADKDLSNLSAAGDTYIKNLAKSAASWNVETNGAGTTAVAGGDTVNFINGDNISITNTGRSITIGTAKNVAFDKVTVGGVVLDKTDGINAGNKEIKGVATGTAADSAVNKAQMDAAITAAASGSLSTETVEAGSTANGKLAAGDTNLATVSGLTGTAKGETYAVTVSENAVKAVAKTAAQDAVKVTGTGLATVTDSTTGGVKTYNVNVDEGKLVIDDTTGKVGAAGSTQGTTQGKNGVATTQDVASVVNSAIDKTKQALDDAEHKFDGDTGTTSVRKHGEVLSIKGGVTTPADLTTGNIGVVSDGAGTLNIRLAKALTGLTSATYTDAAGNTQTVTGGSSTITDGAGNTTTITKGGVTTTDGTNTTTVAPSGVTATDGTHTVTLGGSGINAGGTEIKNIGKATTDDAAVNKKQMDDALKGATDNTVSLGSESGSTTAKKLSTTGGITFNIKGETGANALITTSASGDDVTIAPTAKLTAAVTAAEKSADKDLSNLSAAGDTYIKNLAKSAASWNVETNGAGTTAVAGGDTVNFINGDNIAITNTGRAITIGTAKDVAFDKVTVGGTSGIVIDGTAKQIGGLAAATANDQAVNKGQMDTAIANAQTAATSTEKVVAKTLTGDTNLATVTGRTGTAKGETYEVAVSENAVKAVAQTAAQDAVKVTGTGLATVSDATAAGVKTYTVNVDEGKLVIDDTTGKLGATGATQGTTAGKNGVATTQDVATVVNSAIDKTKQALDDAEHKFDGDTGTTSVRKHGEVLSIKGGVTTPADLTTGNIGVVSDGAGTLNIRLAKALTGLTSATYTDAAGNTQTVTGGSSTITDGAGNTTTITKGGVTTTDGTNTTTVAPSGVTATDGTHTVTLGGSGINAGGTEIKNIGKATTDDAAVNKKQMDDALKGATDNTVSLGSESGSTTAKKLSTTGGITFNIKGETGANALITTSATGDDVTVAPTAKLTAAVTAAENAANKDLSNLNAAGDTYIKNLAKSAASWNVETNGAGTTAVAGGDTVNFINGDNIAITNTGRAITIGTAKDVAFDKVTVGGTSGIVIDGTAKQIGGLAAATANDQAVNKGQMDTAIANAQTAATSTEKVVAKTLTGDTNLATVTGRTGTAKGETYEVAVSENAVKAVAQTAAQDAVKVTGTGLATVSDATAAGVKTYTVNVDEGKLVIDDTTGKLGATGATQGTTAGKNGVATTQDVATVVNSAIDKTKQALDDAEHKFDGDTGTTSVRKHGEVLSIKGGVTTPADLTTGNIGVVSDGAGTLNIRLAKALTGLTSATYTDAAGNTQTVTGGSSTITDGAGNTTTITKGGVTTTDGTNTTTVAPSGVTATDGTHTVTLGGSGINAGGTEIKNVGKATTDDAAVNKKQMDDAVKAATDSVSTLGDNKVSLGSDAGTTNAKKLSTTGGIKFNIKGDAGANALITTSATGDDVTIAPTAKLTAAVTAAEKSADKDLSNLSAAGDTYIKNLAKSAASWNVETNGAGTTAVAGGETVNFINGDNIAITNTGRSITIGTAKNVAFDKVTVGGVVLDKTDGINAGGKEIKGIANGTTADAAVNKGQLDAAVLAAAGGSLSTEKVVAKTLTGDTNLVTVTGQTGTAKGETYEVAVSENAVKAVAQTAAQDAVKVTGTGLATVTDSTTGGVKTYNVDVKTGNLVVNAAGQAGATGTTGAGGASGADGVATTQNVASAINDAITKSNANTAQALADAEHKFDGDTGATSVRKHGEVLSIKGGVTTPADLTTGNLGVVSDGAGTLNIRLAKVLSGLTSASFTTAGGDTTMINGGGVTITPSATGATPISITTAGINAGNKEIKGIANGTTADAAVNKGQLDAAVLAAAGGSLSTEKVVAKTLTGDTNLVTVTGQTGTAKGETYEVAVSENAVKAVAQTAAQDAVKVTGTGLATVTDSTTGGVKTYNVDVTTGNLVVTATGQVGAAGTTGASGASGTNGVATTQNVASAINAAITKSNANTAQALADAEHKFDGDTGTTSVRKHGEVLSIKGGVTTTADLTTGNIGVVSDGAGTLNVRLAKTLTGLTSASFTDGTHTVTIGGSGINAGGTEIKNIGKATTDDAAVNKKQMDDAVKAATDSVSILGDNKVSLGSDAGTTTAKKLSTTGGIKFNIKGDTGTNALITTSATGDDVTIAPTAKLSAAVTAAENAANKDLSNLSAAGDTYIKNLAKTAASWNVETNGTGTTAVAGGDTVNFINGDNIAITNTGRSITIGTAKNVSFDKVTVGGVVIDKNTGIDAGGKEITNVGPATSGNSAVNKTQMDTAITNAVNKATTDAKHDFGGDDATVVTRKHGEKLNIKGGASTTAADLTAGNIAVLGDAATGTLNIRMAKALTGLSSATFTTPSGTTVIDGGGITITPSATGAAPISITTNGINAGNTEIKNVAAGTTPNSAVNKQQMDSAISNATANVGFHTAGNTGTGSVSNGQTLTITGTNGIETNASGQSITVGLDAATRAQINNATTTANNAAKKDLSNIDNTGKQMIKDTAAWNVKVNSAAAETVKGGDTVTFNDGDNIKVTNTGKDITIATKKDVSFDKVTVGNVVIDKNTNRISGLANAVNNDEAVNLGQMNAAISTVTAGTNTIKYKANSGTQNSVALTTGFDFKGDSNIQITADPANSGVINYKLNPALTGITSISGGTGAPTITLNAGSGSNPGNVSINSNLDMGGKQINNIGAATHAGDAVNKAQMDQALQNIAGASSNVAKSYAYKAGAGAAALAALKPIQYDPLEPTQIMAGIGNYKSQTAVALGVAHYTNENTMFNFGVSLDSHDGIVNAGVTHKFGYSPEKKAIPDRYKGGPISSIYVMQDEVTALQAIVQKQAAENEALRQQNEDMQRKVDMILSKIH